MAQESDPNTEGSELLQSIECEHLEFEAKVIITPPSKDRPGPFKNYVVDVNVRCKGCKHPLIFDGMAFFSPDMTNLKLPARSIDQVIMDSVDKTIN